MSASDYAVLLLAVFMSRVVPEGACWGICALLAIMTAALMLCERKIQRGTKNDRTE
jgi:Na+(H+)/acetate symporter ActP